MPLFPHPHKKSTPGGGEAYMIIEQRKVTIGEVCEGCFNDAEEGMTGCGGLNIRQPRK